MLKQQKFQLNDKAIDKVIDFANKRFHQDTKYSAGSAREAQCRLICEGLHDLLCSEGIDPGFEVVLPPDVELDTIEDM